MRRERRWLAATRAFTAGMLGLLLVLMVGACAPKRVQRGSDGLVPPDGESFPGEPGTPPGPPLPEPEARGKVVFPRPQTGDPVQQLRLGIKAATLVQEQLDKPYQWGASGPERFDCSGLVYYVFGSLGVDLPRVSRDQARVGDKVTLGSLQPGDLVFFITGGSRINHVGIYIGDARFVHAPSRHNPVRSDSLNNAYWRRRFQYGRRISG
jgi:hypothetical protein